MNEVMGSVQSLSFLALLLVHASLRPPACVLQMRNPGAGGLPASSGEMKLKQRQHLFSRGFKGAPDGEGSFTKAARACVSPFRKNLKSLQVLVGYSAYRLRGSSSEHFLSCLQLGGAVGSGCMYAEQCGRNTH